MAVTRSRKITTTTISLAPNGKVKKSSKVRESVKVEQTSQVVEEVSKDIKPLQSPKKAKVAKVHIENHFSHIPIPPDLLLPQSFVEYHDEEFLKGVQHILQIDRSLYPAIVHSNFTGFCKETPPDDKKAASATITDYWYALVRSILGQQISGHAAAAIEKRFNELFDGNPTPQATLKIAPDTLKGVGLLSMKLKYITHISETFALEESNLTSVEFYNKCTKSELIEELVHLKGIGEWSAKMFAVFTLRELDLFAYDDLGVARGVARYLEVRPDVLKEVKEGVHAVEELKKGLKKKGKFETKSSKRDWTPLHDEYVKFLGLKFAPYQLVFMLIMWRLASTNIAVLENVR